MSKYKAVRTFVDNIWFDSGREAARYIELRMLVRVGIIRDLELQKRYPIVINGVKVCAYIADFVYRDQSGRTVVEDSKGIRTRDYIIKSKLMLAVHGIRIVET